LTLLPLTAVTKTKEHDFVGNLARAGRRAAEVKLSLWRQVLDENVYLQHPEKNKVGKILTISGTGLRNIQRGP
jgi:hypothetical protein